MNYETDKIGHGYDPIYRRLAAGLYQFQPPKTPYILEIGVGDGGGLVYLSDVFQGMSFGVDNRAILAQSGVAIVDQEDDWFAVKVYEHYRRPGWDVIVDDASHNPALTWRTLRVMWPAVMPGGIYVVEDWNHLDAGEMWDFLAHRVLVDLTKRPRGNVPEGLMDVEGVEIHRKGMVILHRSTRAPLPIPPARPVDPNA